MEIMPDIIHESWRPYLQPLFDDVKMVMIKNQILPKATFYPAKENIFKVFSTSLYDIKAVVLGQDPYPRGEAIGLAFAVKTGTTLPPSLKVIKAEVQREFDANLIPISVGEQEDLQWETLAHWQEQGVFLLNTALTVEANIAGSHLNYWSWFTREVIKIISLNNPTIWLLWGAKAQGFTDYIQNRVLASFAKEVPEVDISNYNVILKADHPQAENYNGGTSSTKFSGCNHFHLCNHLLLGRDKPIIRW